MATRARQYARRERRHFRKFPEVPWLLLLGAFTNADRKDIWDATRYRGALSGRPVVLRTVPGGVLVLPKYPEPAYIDDPPCRWPDSPEEQARIIENFRRGLLGE